MDEHELRDWLRQVREGVVSRRQFTRAMIGNLDTQLVFE